MTRPNPMETNVSDKFLRLPHILGDPKATPPIPALVPVCKTPWHAGIKNGIYPKGVKLSPRVCVWRESEIQALIHQPKK